MSTPISTTESKISPVLYTYGSIGKGARCWIKRPNQSIESVTLVNIDWSNKSIIFLRTTDNLLISENIWSNDYYQECDVDWVLAK